jgi:tRNA pseudouridine55 synthase
VSGEILLVDKPVGFSSFQIVSILKKNHKKVGHAGTLDPFASGLLIILIGNATKDFISYQQCEKEYVGEILLGMITDTYDIAGRALEQQYTEMKNTLTLGEFNQRARSFIGEIEQTPPRFSALKQGGMKLYELSRKGLAVQPKKRTVIIEKFSITAVDYPILHFHTLVGSGVYIRSLAHSFGRQLGCGATLLSLKRIRIGEYQLQQAKKVGELLS